MAKRRGPDLPLEGARRPEMVRAQPPEGVCKACLNRNWWSGAGLVWICGSCHAPAPDAGLVVWAR